MAAGHCDLLIVGSGFGGAVCALRAARAGLRVVVLERGRRMTDEAFDAMAAGQLAVFHSRKEPGLIELHRLSGLLAVSASAVGGGSLVYTAVTLPAPREVFGSGWPARIDHDTLSPYYARVAEMIRPTEIPLPLSRTSALEKIAGRLGGCVSRMPLAMDWPKDGASLHERHSADSVSAELVAWLRGGPAASKRTLAQTYLPQAEAAGAEIRALHEVLAIVPEDDAYRTKYRRLQDGEWREDSIVARRVVLAAGTLGTTRLLLECRDVLQTLPNLSAALGHRFYTNGDFGGLLIGPTPAPVLDGGPPVTAWIDLWEKHRLFIMETGIVPYDTGSLAGLLNPKKWLGGMKMKPAKQCVWSFGVMGFEENPGTLRLSRWGKLIHRRDAGVSEEYRRRMTAVLEDLAAAAGAKLVRPPAIIARLLPITVHPLGGATMADSPDGGVVDPNGEVFGYPGLYVADGSLVPTPTGVPPSMTIAAMAERIVENLIKQ
jgi:cholesterol oxidase